MTGRRAALLGAALGVVMLAVAPAHAGSVTTVHSERGIVAAGSVTDWRSGRVWTLAAMLVVPEATSAVDTTLSSSALDLAKPWATVTVQHGDGTCRAVANVSSYSAGYRSVYTYPYGGTSWDVWTGVFVDVSCPDGQGYAFYRVALDHPIGTTATFPIRRTQAATTADGFDGGDFDVLIAGVPDWRQGSKVSVCGHRPDGHVECFGDGWGCGEIRAYSPAGGGMLVTLHTRR